METHSLDAIICDFRFMILDLIHRIKRKLVKLRLQPIRVYCLHHVCAEFDSDSMNACDWMQIDEFKKKVAAMQQDGVEFISLKEAYRHICNDRIRSKKYAVLTFDDGYASLKEILPWLDEQNIPATLFLNPAYLDGKHYRKRETEMYLTEKELKQIGEQYPLLTIGSHGWEHIEVSELNKHQFEESVSSSTTYLSQLPNYIPFFAFPYGRGAKENVDVLQSKSLIPVFVKGNGNYNDKQAIHRELLEV